MARNIMIVDGSVPRRRVIASMIMANLSDAEVTEAKNAYEAWELLQRAQFNLILFFWEPSAEAWLNFFLRLKKHPTSNRAGAILLTTDTGFPYVKEALRAGVADTLTIPCGKLELTNAVNRVCNPVAFHQSPRHSLPGTTALLQQGSRSYHARVINVSLGGLLCEFDYIEDFSVTTPATINITFQHQEKQLTANGLYSIPIRFYVLDNNANYSPNRVRIAYRFAKLPMAVQDLFEQLFQFATEQERLLLR
ncbi:MAG TPA: response regulator [Desulfurivibrio alkaliphilus]|uniref:Response regulator n=1 Tax=Desulfurivibrio alkaliphilus TaxID=427923 RepID=A0A7C2XN55_9BACT|nr:response regulator [Desulfurivibrio alkaliphilus]